MFLSIHLCHPKKQLGAWELVTAYNEFLKGADTHMPSEPRDMHSFALNLVAFYAWEIISTTRFLGDSETQGIQRLKVLLFLRKKSES